MPKIITATKSKVISASHADATVRGSLVEPSSRFKVSINASCFNNKPTGSLFFEADFLPLGVRDIVITSNRATEVAIERFPGNLVHVHFKNVSIIRRTGPALNNAVALVQALEFPGSGIFDLDIIVRNNGKPVFNFSRNLFGKVKVNRAVFCEK